METGDHFKNGASLKSLTSRGNLNNLHTGCINKSQKYGRIIIILLLITSLLVTQNAIGQGQDIGSAYTRAQTAIGNGDHKKINVRGPGSGSSSGSSSRTKTTTAKPAVVPKRASTTKTTPNTYNSKKFQTQTRKNDFKTTRSATASTSTKNSFKRVPSYQPNAVAKPLANNANTRSILLEESNQMPSLQPEKTSNTVVEKYRQYHNIEPGTPKTNTVVEKYRQYHNIKRQDVRKIQAIDGKTVYSVSGISMDRNTELMDGTVLSDKSAEQYLWNGMTEVYQGLNLSVKVLESPAYKRGVTELGNIAPENKTLSTLKNTSGNATNWVKSMRFAANRMGGIFGDEGKTAQVKAELVGYLKKIGTDVSSTLTKGSTFLESARKHTIVGMSLIGNAKNNFNNTKKNANDLVNNGFSYSPEKGDQYIYEQISGNSKAVKKGMETMTNNK
jgi:hypothetical protein